MTPTFFFGRSLPFLILSIVLKHKKICTWEVAIISHIAIQIGSNWSKFTKKCMASGRRVGQSPDCHTFLFKF